MNINASARRMLRLFAKEIESILRRVPSFAFLHGSVESNAAQEACNQN